MMNEEKLKRPTFCGYLHVKRPADQRYTLIRPLSGWKSRLVTIMLDELREDNERTNVVKILLGKKQASLANRTTQIKTDNNNETKKVSRTSRNRILLKSNNCVIYRCRSRKEPHAFVLANQTRPLLYLAAGNEILCQHWIKTIRDCLWPPNAQQAALESDEKVFSVSLVDNEYSFRANLVGIYGYICYDLPHKLVLRNSQDGTLIQDWTLNTVSMRLVGEAAQESFALIERVSLNDEHVFVELNSDFVPNHINENESIAKLTERLASDCNLVLMNCSMDATTGPGLITFFSENAYQLVRQFKIEKQRDLAELRKKQQIPSQKNIMIEDLIVDTVDQTDQDEFSEKLNEKLNEILQRKLSNAFMTLNDENDNQATNSSKLDEEKRTNKQTNNQQDESTINLKEFNFEKNLKEFSEQPNKMQLDRSKLPLYASSSELLDSDCSSVHKSFEQSIENSLDSMNEMKSKLQEELETQEFESSLDSSD